MLLHNYIVAPIVPNSFHAEYQEGFTHVCRLADSYSVYDKQWPLAGPTATWLAATWADTYAWIAAGKVWQAFRASCR